jgi:transcriptional regulator with XRE-family HTH domain
MLDFTFATASELSKEIASRMKAQRMRLELSQPELAQRAGVALGTVSGFEKSGKATLETVIRLIVALDLTKEIEPLFLQKPTSIRELELATKPVRQRVPQNKSFYEKTQHQFLRMGAKLALRYFAHEGRTLLFEYWMRR